MVEKDINECVDISAKTMCMWAVKVCCGDGEEVRPSGDD